MTQPKALQLNGGKQGVMLFHGLSSAPQELQFLARGLQRAGYSVRLPVIPGYSHGFRTDEPSKAEHWQAAALAEFDAFAEQHESVAVGGLCIGAVLSLRIAAMRRDRLSGLMGLSTTLHYDGWAVPWFRRLIGLHPFVPFSGHIPVVEKFPYGVKDERMRGFIQRQMEGEGSSDAGAAILRVRELYQAHRLIQMARRSLSQINAPTLLIHAHEDEAASPRSAFEAAAAIRSRTVRTVLLNDSYHMISIDREKQRVLAEMTDFLTSESTRHGAIAPSTPSSQQPAELSNLFRLNSLLSQGV